MGPIQLHHQIYSHPPTLEKATESAHGYIQVDEIVKTMIDKISSTVFQEGKGSTVFCPVSVAPILGMMLASMEDNRDKEKMLGIPEGKLTPELEIEIHRKLGEFSRSHDGDNATGPDVNTPIVTFNFSASRYHSPDEQFQEILLKYYQAKILEQESNKKNVADIADDFVKQKTNNKITTLFDGLTELDRYQVKAVLGNVMDIKAIWQTLFSPEETREMPFLREDGLVIENVQMMNTTDDLPLAQDDKFAATSKDFKSVNGEQLKLVVITPIKYSASTIKELDRATINKLMDELAYSPKKRMKLVLPKMEIDSNDDKLLGKVNKALKTNITAQQLSKLGTEPCDGLDLSLVVKGSVGEDGVEFAVASSAQIHTRSWGSLKLPTLAVDCPSFIVITNGQENLVEAVVKCGKFLCTRGVPNLVRSKQPTNVEKHKYVTDDHLKFSPSPIQPLSLPQEVKKDNGLDLKTLIKSKLNLNEAFEIIKIEKTSFEVSIAVGSLGQAEELAKKLVEFLGKEHENFVTVWSYFDPVRVDVRCKAAMETLIEKLTS